MKTVAIVGADPKTRELAPYDNKNIDIWTLNQAGKLAWARRWDALFQVHDKGIIQVNQYSQDYWEWLKEERGKPIYMLKPLPEIPDAVQYPLDEVIKSLPCEPRMFGSSMTYMLALAAYLKYEKVMLFGIEMKWQSEYGYQRETFLYWYGLLQGMGIKMEKHCGFLLFDRPLYGTETNWIVQPSRFAKRVTQLGKEIRRAEAKASTWSTDDVAKYTASLQDFGYLYGRRAEAERYYKMLSDMQEKTDQIIIDTGEPERAIKTLIPQLHEARLNVERALGMDDKKMYSEAVFAMAQIAGRIYENEDLKKEAPV